MRCMMDNERRPRVVLADDHQIVLDGIERLLDSEFEVVGAFLDGNSLLEAAGPLDPDVFVVDISMPTMNGIETAKVLKERCLRGKVVFLTVHQSPAMVDEALATGALGYVLKPNAAEQLPVAIRAALAGRSYICPSLQS